MLLWCMRKPESSLNCGDRARELRPFFATWRSLRGEHAEYEVGLAAADGPGSHGPAIGISE